MAGFLVPDRYQNVAPSTTDQLVASIIWGFTIAVGIFSAQKAGKQTWDQYKRTGRFRAYVWMIWAEWLASMIIGILSWCFIRGFIAPRRNAVKIRWMTAIVLGLINISVFCIWIPAQLQISQKWHDINYIWDRIEKGLFLVIDAMLHGYFIYLIRIKLIANGLTKYQPLMRYNFAMIFISMSLDIILIGSMSIGNGFIYVQFHPLVYMLKLHIEMNISALIVRVVRATGDHSSYPDGYEETELRSKVRAHASRKTGSTRAGPMFSTTGRNLEVRVDAGESNDTQTKPHQGPGITKVTQTHVQVMDKHDEDDASSQSSTRHLKEPYAYP
ncbi:hypothetical protein NW752_011971 [Fusarium irregulare]|uniref:Integral membrane protein n=1 Tax=Fusarium irregulare TaxID=2494466 RepID=A0A9W8PGS6_9HYPO|nr:hypothetical protein NW752_011971 [Fusarium irregulare]KAJ4006426.1 hypothetical protein NW766_010513 [Fusarium irregulare]